MQTHSDFSLTPLPIRSNVAGAIRLLLDENSQSSRVATTSKTVGIVFACKLLAAYKMAVPVPATHRVLLGALITLWQALPTHVSVSQEDCLMVTAAQVLLAADHVVQE